MKKILAKRMILLAAKLACMTDKAADRAARVVSAGWMTVRGPKGPMLWGDDPADAMEGALAKISKIQ